MTNPSTAPSSLPPIKEWIVLIVDDQEDNLVVSSTTLEFQGAKVHTATNGQACVEKLQTVRPTVILMDLSMPRMDGWEALKYIRETPELATIPVIALTAHAMGGDKERILEAGFDGYIAKPFEVFGLAQNIQNILLAKLDKKVPPKVVEPAPQPEPEAGATDNAKEAEAEAENNTP